MLPPRQTRGLMLVRKPEKLVTAYEASIPQWGQEYLLMLWAALAFINPKNYRGISREPLEPWSKVDEDLFQRGKKTLVDLRRDQAARRKFLDINGEDRDDWDSYVNGWDYNQALIQDMAVAKELRGVADLPEDFEIIEVARDTFGTEYSFLGFDIGYWRSDYFSLVCDSAIMPRWHSPVPESFGELGNRLRCLNEHLLFSSDKDAEGFREYYMSQHWAEKESYEGQFCIIQVATASTGG